MKELIIQAQDVDSNNVPTQLARKAITDLRKNFSRTTRGEINDFLNPETLASLRGFADGLLQSGDDNMILQEWSLFDPAIFNSARKQEENKAGTITSSSPLGQFKEQYRKFFQGVYQNNNAVQQFDTIEDANAADVNAGWYYIAGKLVYLADPE